MACVTAFDIIYFNPRSRVGSDARLSPYSGGAAYFNPRSRVGSDCEMLRLFETL